MSDLWQTTSSSPALHLYGNIAMSLLYLAAFVLILRFMLMRAIHASFFSLFTCFVFLLMAVMLLIHAFGMSPWPNPFLQVLWIVLASAPALVFLCFRNKPVMWDAKSERESAERFNKLKDDFLTVASHELRTPLSVINGFAEILVREKLGPLNDEQKRRVRKILMQGQRLNRIINELLDLSRIRSGKIEMRKDVFAVVPVLKACIDDHQIVCDQQQIELYDEIPDMLPDVVGDLERVTQIVVNLLNNAIKYTEAGGSVALYAVHEEDKKSVRVEVRDTGTGIPPEDQVNVFKEFFRSRQHANRKYSGSGLGLAIVKQLVEAQGGQVGLHSEGLGKGSTFFFTLPTAGSTQDQIGSKKTVVLSHDETPDIA